MYVAVYVYVYFMWQMVPRLWTYQIELPARTVVHLSLGMAIGAVLIVKVLVVRFFKHLEGTLVPFLGTILFIFCTVLLVGLTLLVALRETLLRRAALNSDAFGEERTQRVRSVLPLAGITDPEQLDALATPTALMEGQEVLQEKCTQCHDLRTALAQPRTPAAWRQTVARMADRSTVLNPISESEQLRVAAYLIAISPTPQRTLEQRRRLSMEEETARDAMAEANPGRGRSLPRLRPGPSARTVPVQMLAVPRAHTRGGAAAARCRGAGPAYGLQRTRRHQARAGHADPLRRRDVRTALKSRVKAASAVARAGGVPSPHRPAGSHASLGASFPLGSGRLNVKIEP